MELEEQAREAQKAAERKQKADAKLVSAYIRVYGREGKRDEAQEMVWASMMNTLQMPNHYVLQPDGSMTMIESETEARLNEGARTYIWNLKRMIESPSKSETE